MNWSLVWAIDASLDAESQTGPNVFSTDVVCLEKRHDDIDEPKKAQEDEWSKSSVFGSAEFSAYLPASEKEHHNTYGSANDEDDNGEAETASWHEVPFVVISLLVASSDEPWQTETQENVYWIGTGNITNGSIGVLFLLSSLHTCKSIW